MYECIRMHININTFVYVGMYICMHVYSMFFDSGHNNCFEKEELNVKQKSAKFVYFFSTNYVQNARRNPTNLSNYIPMYAWLFGQIHAHMYVCMYIIRIHLEFER